QPISAHSGILKKAGSPCPPRLLPRAAQPRNPEGEARTAMRQRPACVLKGERNGAIGESPAIPWQEAGDRSSVRLTAAPPPAQSNKHNGGRVVMGNVGCAAPEGSAPFDVAAWAWNEGQARELLRECLRGARSVLRGRDHDAEDVAAQAVARILERPGWF